MSNFVLDASALLAYLLDEPRLDIVDNAINEGSYISIVNWTKVLSRVAALEINPQTLAEELENQGLLGIFLEILPVTREDALLAAQLRPLTKTLGLSLGDRICVALGLRLGLPILTGDRLWINLLSLGVQVQLIR